MANSSADQRKPRWKRKRDGKLIASAAQQLEDGEDVIEIFFGEGGMPVVGGAWWAPRRIVMVTDRNVYIFNKARSRFKVDELIYKARLGEITASCGPGTLHIGNGPRVAISLGNSGLGTRRRVAALVNQGAARTPSRGGDPHGMAP